MDASYIYSLMVQIKAMSEDQDNYTSKIISAIPEGGEHSFTNKVRDGKVIPDSRENLFILFAMTYNLIKFSEQISQNPKLPDKNFYQPIVVYRAINLEDAHIGHKIQPVPVSASWDRDFAINWVSNLCCVYEITVDFPTFLPFSTPKDDSIFKRMAINQVQKEVILPPCRLVKTGEYIHITKDGKKVRFIVCTAKKLLMSTVANCYPEAERKIIKNKLKHRRDINGWVNEILYNHYDETF